MPADSYVSIKLPKDIYDLVVERAQTEERSTTGEIRRLLKRALTDAPEEMSRAA